MKKFFPILCSLAAYSVFALNLETEIMTNSRQLTFEGVRSGEGYFSSSGNKIVYQSENSSDNPFYQIYLLDLLTGENDIVTSGTGKTTCAWIHPDEKTILFSSTHLDPLAQEKQKEEIKLRESGKARKYSWDYDQHYDLFKKDTVTGKSTRLTFEDGYDAEGSFSPNGNKVVFASNRNAYSKALSKKEQDIFNRDKSFFNDIYIMDHDGSNVQQLTDTPGYDGGPFFNAQGNQICWRRFTPSGHKAEIYTMDLSTRVERKITSLDAMSWAPFFHPSNDYLVFSTNIHGFNNFELYAVDALGNKEPIRITDSEGFDGLPSFSPSGKYISWTSNKTNDKKSQLFLAEWNHSEILRRLDLSPMRAKEKPTKPLGKLSKTSHLINAEDIQNYLSYLCSEELKGRFTGSEGEKLAGKYVAEYFHSFGMEPFSMDGNWFQEFPFFNTAELSPSCKLQYLTKESQTKTLKLSTDWVPMPFSDSGNVEIDEITFAGYGVRTKKTSEWPEYDSYTHLDVKDKWVLVLRKLPITWTEKRKNAFYHNSTFRKKSAVARDLGAKGIIFVSDFSDDKDDLVEFSGSAAKDTMSIMALSVTRDFASTLFLGGSRDFFKSCKQLSTGEPRMGFAISDTSISLDISINRKKGTGRNTLGWIRAQKGKKTEQVLIIGAHIDHIGIGKTSSRAKKSQKGKIHPGADDNASGIGALLEIAEYLSFLKSKGLLDSLYDILFVAWSGEEIGLIGSSYFTRSYPMEIQNSDKRKVIAYLNMDMVGRYDEKLTIHGVGSSTQWKRIIQKANVPVGLNLNLQNDSHIPTDTTSFFSKGIPILSAFTGLHPDYHSPADTVDKINYKGISGCAKLFSRLIETLCTQDELDYVAQAPPAKSRGRLRVYLGTIPDYSQTDQKGVLLSGVSKGGPADLAGIRSNDLIISLGNEKVESIYDYTDAISLLKPKEEAEVIIMRDAKRLTLKITPSAR